MKLCKCYIEGMSCPQFEKCPNDHIDIRNLVRCEMETQLNGSQWPLSCFGPFIGKPSIPNYIEDQSFEEIRMMYYDSNTTFFQSAQKLSKALKEAEDKMKILMSMNREVVDKLADLYNCTESPKETNKPQNTQSGVQSPFGRKDYFPLMFSFVKNSTSSQQENNTALLSQPLVQENALQLQREKGFFNDSGAHQENAQPFGLVGFPQQHKDEEVNCSPFGAPQPQKKEEHSVGLFGIPKPQEQQHEKLNFGVFSAARPQEQKIVGLAQDLQPQTGFGLFTGPNPRPQQLVDIFRPKPQNKNAVFGVLGTTKPLQQSEHHFGFFNITEPEKKPQQPQQNAYVFGVPRPQEQKQPSLGFFSSPEQHCKNAQKQDNTENSFGFLGVQKPQQNGPLAKGSYSLPHPVQPTIPRFLGFPTTQKPTHLGFNNIFDRQKQKQLHSNGSPLLQTPLVPGRECDDCKGYLKDIAAKIDNLLRVVKENKTTLTAQEDEINSIIDCLKQSVNEKLGNVENKTNVPLLGIKPKGEQSSEHTKNDIQDKIVPLDLSAQIDSVSKSFESSILIKCRDEESMRALETEIIKCGANYDVKALSDLKDPQIVVSEIDNKFDDHELVDIIKQQNKLDGKMNLIKSFGKGKNGSKYNAVFEVDKNLYRRIMLQNDPRFFVGWDECYVQDNFNIKRCFNCWGFDHVAKSCTNFDKPFESHQLTCTTVSQASRFSEP